MRAMKYVVMAAVVGLGGCAGYTTWPPVEENYTGQNEMNTAQTPPVVGSAVRYVAVQYPPVARPVRGETYDEPFAVNLPEGSDADTYAAVAKRVGHGCVPAMEENRDLPTYHVTRVALRGVTAEVDVLRPVMGPEGSTMKGAGEHYQGVTVYLNTVGVGALSGWKVVSHKAYPIGVFEAPERHETVVGAEPRASVGAGG